MLLKFKLLILFKNSVKVFGLCVGLYSLLDMVLIRLYSIHFHIHVVLLGSEEEFLPDGDISIYCYVINHGVAVDGSAICGGN